MPSLIKKPSIARTLLFAAGVALVCGTLVSLVSVLLEPRQSAHRQGEREAALAGIVANQPGIESALRDVDARRLHAHVIDTATGCFDETVDPDAFDQLAAIGDAGNAKRLSEEADIAQISHRPDRMMVHLVHDDEELALIILPVYGLGYNARMYGYLTLAGDANTIVALNFYQHAESPGMGGVVGDPDWQARWQGKRIRDERGVLRVGVQHGRTDGSSTQSDYEIDAMTGATVTGRGVTNLLRFWLGEDGHAPLLRNLSSGAECTRPRGQ